VAQKIRDGKSVLLFPEGHRSRTGRMLPFKGGSFHIAILAGVPIVPITLKGTRHVHPAIPTEGLTLHEVDALSQKVRQAIESRFVAAEE
jgi:1-acyl-sn-glycerol-3-phosphate acyltransferase